MWKLIEFEDGKDYCLALCQDHSNKRYCRIIEVTMDSPNQVIKTVAIPQALLKDRASMQISANFLLTSGQKFIFGSHGEWFTQDEIEALDNEGFLAVPWVSGTEPKLPSR